MLKLIAAWAALAALAAATAGCGAMAGTTKPEAGAMAGTTKAQATGIQPTAFEAWAVGNATGAFFKPVGPGGGSGVR